MIKRIRKAIAVLSVIAVSVSSLSPIVTADNISNISDNAIYVATDGNDTSGDGSIGNPYATIYKARDVVRERNDDMTEDITIYFRGGTYYLNETIELGVEDSGTNGHYIEYKAYPTDEEPVIFNGGTKVEGWEQDLEYPNLYSTTLKRDKKLRQLYVNDKRAYMPSRSAKALGGYGEYKVTKGQADWAWDSLTKSDGVQFGAEDLPGDIKNPEDIEVQSSMTWNTSTVAVRGVQETEDGTVALLEQPYGVIAQNVGWAPYQTEGENTIYNIFEDLDEPGEFYFDREAQKLYYYPREGEDMSIAEVYAPKLDTLLRIQGVNLTMHASYIRFEGITFANTDWLMQDIGGSHGKVTTQGSLSVIATGGNNNHGGENNWHKAVYREFDVTAAAVEMTSADHISFCNNIIKHTANDTLNMINDVTNCVVDGNQIYDSGAAGTSIGHPQHTYVGDKGNSNYGYFSEKEKYDVDVEGLCTDITFTNNLISGTGCMFYGSVGLMIFYGQNILVENNQIEDTTYSAINLGWSWCNFDGTNSSELPDKPMRSTINNKILNNRLINTVTKLSDGGAIYTLGRMDGCEISGNYITKVGQNGFHGRGIHLDEGTQYLTGENNVIEVEPYQVAIDCSLWQRKANNTFNNNYSTTNIYTSNGSYEPGTIITNKHVDKTGLWSSEEAISIIRNSGLADEYVNRFNRDIQDMILPADYLLTKDNGISEICVPDIDGDIWLAPEGTTEFVESATVKQAHPAGEENRLRIPETEDYYRIYVIQDGMVSAPSTGKISTKIAPDDLNVLGPYWAYEADNCQGEKGDMAVGVFGTSQNVNKSTSLFGITADHLTLLFDRINGLDSTGAGWIGYLEQTVNAYSSGTYKLYILCYGSSGRKYNVYLNGLDGEKAVTTSAIVNDASSVNAYSTSNCLNVLEVTISLKEGENIIALQGNGAGPNYVAMALVKTAEDHIQESDDRNYIELTGDLDIFNGDQTDNVTLTGPSSTNQYVKNVFGSGGWQPGNTYSYGVSVDYRAAFDSSGNDANEYFDGPVGGWCGVEFNEPQIISRVGYLSRENCIGRLDGVVLQGSNDGINYVDLCVISGSSDSEMQYMNIEKTDNAEAYRFVRLIRTDSTVLNIQELKLYTSDTSSEEHDQKGDVNLDGKMTSVDALLVLKMAVSEDFGTPAQRRRADITEDGKVMVDDVQMILKYVSGEHIAQ